MSYDKLFLHMINEHGIFLNEQEMQEICDIVKYIQGNTVPYIAYAKSCGKCGGEIKRISPSPCQTNGITYCEKCIKNDSTRID